MKLKTSFLYISSFIVFSSFNFITDWYTFDNDYLTLYFPEKPTTNSQMVESSVGKLNLKTAFFEPFSKHSMSASYSPLAIGLGLQSYLEAFPYGCTEQVISRTLPSVLLTSYISGKNKKLIEKQKENLKSITRILRSRQAAA